eukprot:CAMPEP_0183742150 /NCGR_PEP_ID=MMETSP0737-20130205/64047_1 /TAXON_ID=385413 /ORGANISM="Thalassiosira miniscula, Strain CCMP1093" /LENGTH=390 /DNA_ID=CAMNT_0025977685 /DNA_START=266 /DNA_END=1435 /DNA_ORIENTATION=-
MIRSEDVYCTDDESSSIASNEMQNGHFDFSAWESFRKYLPLKKQEDVRRLSTLIVPFPVVNDEESEIDDAQSAADASISDSEKSKCANDRATNTLELTEEESYENARWSMRLKIGKVFETDYVPEIWEKKEMNAIIDFLALKKPNEKDHPRHMVKPELVYQVTKSAISSIFFEKPGEIQSVLLKRGPVLLNGEERELMLFTNGFLFSRVELNELANLLVNDDRGGSAGVTHEHLRERFSDIDVDNSGSLDRSEIYDFFQKMGWELTDSTIDDLLNKFDSDSDGNISLDEFESMMYELQHMPEMSSIISSMKKIRFKLMNALHKRGFTHKLDAAFQLEGIEKIENISIFHSTRTKLLADSKWGQLTFAVHINGVAGPLLVTCAKPGHVEAW